MASATVRTPAQGFLSRCVRLPEPVPTAPRAVPALPPALKPRTRAFIQAMARAIAAGSAPDPVEVARSVGYTRPTRAVFVAQEHAEVIQAEADRLRGQVQMEMDEALRGTAALARSASDERVKLGSYQTILRVHGALSEKVMPPAERRSIAGMIEELVLSIADKSASAVNRQHARAIVERTDKSGARVRVGVEVQTAPAELPPPADGLDPDPTDI